MGMDKREKRLERQKNKEKHPRVWKSLHNLQNGEEIIQSAVGAKTRESIITAIHICIIVLSHGSKPHRARHHATCSRLREAR